MATSATRKRSGMRSMMNASGFGRASFSRECERSPTPWSGLERVIENSLKNYLGAGIFDGGCFLLNSLVELAGQSPAMSNHVLQGFRSFAELLHQWLKEAEQQGLLKEGLNLRGDGRFSGDHHERGLLHVCCQQRPGGLAANPGATHGLYRAD